ncbi:MFS transporter [Alloalcanivorax marinus]|uniref:MFS transporter n=1 Tax=Alloalcanivorax marinus TaxID=1177169 RepID=UPI0019321002|nr:MFS transporter [Alloalcanivorax marinus]MBL7249211.1 MFS transporter [Alloalcanivorax marinus]
MSTKPASGAIRVMAVAAGVVVANNYYNQPLLNDMARDLGVSGVAASWISSLTQIGYALGLLLLLPLADRMDRRRLITVMLLLASAMLFLFALSPSYQFVLAFGFLIGLTSIVPQILPPAAQQLVPPAAAPEAVGRIMAGLLLGIVLSRFVGGWLGNMFGWRALYGGAAVVMLVLVVLLRRVLPPFQTTFHGGYLSLMGSLGRLFLAHSVLRGLAFAGAMQFAAFSLFWTTLAFHLAAMPGHYPASVAGSFALIGAVGVLGAGLVARLSRRSSVRFTLMVSGLLMLVAFPVFLLAEDSLWWMVPAVLLLDLGMQMSHVTSMATILSLDRAAASRLNTLYMFIRFLGGALGTLVGGFAWWHGGWLGVCLCGLGFCMLALVVNMRRYVAGTATAS